MTSLLQGAGEVIKGITVERIFTESVAGDGMDFGDGSSLPLPLTLLHCLSADGCGVVVLWYRRPGLAGLGHHTARLPPRWS